MSRNIFSEPRLFIGNKEHIDYTSISYKNKGDNKSSSLDITLSDPQLDETAMLGKEVVFYLNYGSSDSVPFFRGYIKQFTPSDKNIKIIAHDVLSLLAGTDSLPLTITDEVNYDGYTVGQMLYDYINSIVNKVETKIGLDMLNDSNPKISLSGYRNDSVVPLKVIQDKLKSNSDNLTDIKNTRLVVRDDGTKANIAFVQEQDIDSAGIRFSFNDGVEKLSYKRRQSPNFFTLKVNDNKMSYQHNTLPTGIVTGKMKGKFTYPDAAREQAFIRASHEEDKKEIKLTTNKGHYLEIGNVINLQTPEHPELIGKHRIVSKDIKISKSKVICNLSLNKEAPSVSSYLSSS